MIRRLFTIMFAMLLWSVQTADAAIDHSEEFAGADSSVVMVVADEGGAESGMLNGIACEAGCICHVFHHAWLDDFASSLTEPCIDGEAYALADSDAAAFLTQPPTRPPLV